MLEPVKVDKPHSTECKYYKNKWFLNEFTVRKYDLSCERCLQLRTRWEDTKEYK